MEHAKASNPSLVGHLHRSGSSPTLAMPANRGNCSSLKAKVPSAVTTAQFRPITILPVAFRTWSSIRARQILRQLQPYAPPTCVGNVPGRQATDIWYHIMMNVEV